MFKRFRKKEAEKSEDLNNETENSGFICPSCYWGFLTAEDLQTHWDKEHGDGQNTEKSQPRNTSAVIKNGQDSSKIWNERTGSLLSFDDESQLGKTPEDMSLLDTTLKDLEEKSAEVVALQREINDINAALKEEKWYSSALKEEVDKLEAEKQERLEAYQALEQGNHKCVKEYEEKLKTLEQEKVTEIDQLKQNLVYALEAKSGSQEEQLSLVQKSSEMSSELVSLQSRLKEEEQKRISFETSCQELKAELDDKIKMITDFETQLGQRPTTEHVTSLQVHIQSLEEQVKTTKNERDSERMELNQKYQNTVEMTKSLQSALDAASDYRKQVEENQGEKQQLVLSMKQELDQTKVSVKEKEQFVEFLQKQLEEVKQNHQNELSAKDEAKHEVRRLQSLSEEQERELNAKEAKLVEIEKSLVQCKADTSRMEEERNDLIQKIEAGEGISTAINQLNQEKDQLEERLKEAEKHMESQTEENSSKIEELHKRNNEIMEELEQSKLNANKTSVSLKEKSDELENLTSILQELKTKIASDNAKLASLEQEKLQLNVKLETLSNSHKEKEEEVSSLQTTLTKVAEEKGGLQEKLDTNLKILDERFLELEAKRKEFEVTKESLQTAATSKENEMKSQLTELMGSLKSVKEKLNISELKIQEKETEIEDVKLQIEKMAQERSLLEEQKATNEKVSQEEMKKLQAKIQEGNDMIEKKSEECRALQTTLDRKDEQLQELRQQIEAQEQQLTKPCQSCFDYDKKLCRSEELLNQEKQLVAVKEKELSTAHESLAEISKRIEALEEEKQRMSVVARESEAKAQEEISRIVQEKLKVEDEVAERNSKLEEEKKSHEQLVKQNEDLLEKIKFKDENLKQAEEITLSLQTRIESLERDVENEKLQKQQMSNEMGEKEKLLISQKLEIQNNVETLESSLAKAKEDLDDTKEASKRAQNILKNEMDSLSEKLKNEKDASEQLKLKFDDTESRMNTKLAAANENLASARDDVTKCEEKLKELERELKQKESQHFELKGEIAVLEATIENNHDEKRSLLERCISTEENCKKYLKTTEQLNKKVEELSSAMIELGQENQNLQVVQNLRSNRKWERDSEVVQCHGCSKKFSVSVRKHHCRNCGSIFCAECTAKTATVAGNKKPARVCDPCYNELNVPVRSYSLNSSNTS